MISQRKKTIRLRQRGYSFREISEIIGISKSTASLWSRKVKLSKKAKKRINNISIKGRKKAVETNKRKREIENKLIVEKVEKYFSQAVCQKIDPKLACALLYWCEGGKYDSGVVFINSDPEIIKYFLYTFRKSFDLEEKKFRALVHLHKYHNKEKQLKFWSDITNIPVNQFFKPYFKSNTGKIKRKDYQGCISVRYYNKKISKELILIYKKLSESYGGVG